MVKRKDNAKLHKEKRHVLKDRGEKQIRNKMDWKVQGHPTTDSLQLVTAVATVVVIITFPLGTDTATVHTGKLACLAPRSIVGDAVLVVCQVPASL